MKQLLIKLTSRKFLLAAAAFIVSIAHANVISATTIAIAYLAAEGYVDGQNTPPQL